MPGSEARKPLREKINNRDAGNAGEDRKEFLDVEQQPEN